MSADPLSGSLFLPQSLNRYAYVDNDPLNMIDPLGLHWECVEATLRSEGGVSTSSKCKWVADDIPMTIFLGSGPPLVSGRGGGPRVGRVPVPTKTCTQVGKFQQIGIALQGAAAKVLGKTIGLGLGVTGSAGNIVGIAGSGSMQLVVSPNGQAAYVSSLTDVRGSVLPLNAAVTPGAGVVGGFQYSFSNAQTPQDLAGSFLNGGGAMAMGLGVAGDMGVGSGTQGQFVWQTNVTVGFGAGGRGSALTPTVSFVTPICQ